MGVNDKMHNAGEQAVGRAKEWVGDKADNPDLADEGRSEQDEARLRQAGEHIKDAGENIKDAAHKVRDTFHR